MDKVAVLLPCFNEATTIAKVVADFRMAVPEAVIYVYDNNSTDGTDELARQAGAVVRYEHQQGKGNVMRRMFREIDAECYVMCDGDDTYPADKAPELIRQVMEQGADMAIGDRLSANYYTENTRPMHNMGNNVVRMAVNLLFHNDIPDIMTGLRAFSYRFVKSFPVLSRGFEIETEMTIHAIDKNMRVAQVPIDTRSRPEGSFSKLNTVRDGLKILWTIFKLFKDDRPHVFFAILTGLMAMVSLILHLTCGGSIAAPAALLTVSLFACGVILSSLRRQERRTFEWQLQRLEHTYKELLREAAEHE